MAIVLKKKVFHHGATSCIGLPQSWLRYYGSRADEITLIGDGILLIVPSGLEAQAEALVKQMESQRLIPDSTEVSNTKTMEEVHKGD